MLTKYNILSFSYLLNLHYKKEIIMKYVQQLCLVLFICFTQILSAQFDTKTYEITIITVDKDGNEKIKNLLFEGQDLSQEEIDALVKNEMDGTEKEVNVNVNVSQDNTNGDAQTITTIIKDRANLTDEESVIVEDKEMKVEVIKDRIFIDGNEVKEGDFDEKTVRIYKFEKGDEKAMNELLDGEELEIGKDEKIYIVESEEKDSGIAFLGVTTSSRGATGGLLITRIVEGSSAEKVGLIKGDVLVRIGGKVVYSYSSLSNVIKSYLPGEVTKLIYRRGEEILETDVALGDFEEYMENQDRKLASQNSSKANVKTKASLGVHIKSINDQIVVSHIRNNGPADKAGIQKGDIILSVDNEEMLNAKQFYYGVADHEVGETVKVKILRNGKKQKLNATLYAMNDKTRRYKQNTSTRKERIIIRDNQGIAVVESEPNRAIKINNFELSPNPSVGQITVDIEMEALSLDEVFSIRIVSIDGKIIRKEKLDIFDGRIRREYDLSKVGNGIYFFQIDQENQSFTKRFVIEGK